MGRGRGRVLVLAFLSLNMAACSRSHRLLSELKTPDPYQNAVVVLACGTFGGATHLYFTQAPSNSATLQDTRIAIHVEGGVSQTGGTFPVLPNSPIVIATRCTLAGECERATWGTLRMEPGNPQGHAFGQYELGFRDGTVETAKFHAAYRAPYEPLVCF